MATVVANSVGPVLRAGFTEVLDSEMDMRWIKVTHWLIEIPAKPPCARLAVLSKMTSKNTAVSFTDQHRRHAVLARREFAVAIAGKAADFNTGFACDDQVQHASRGDGTEPRTCRRGKPNKHLMVRQNWMAASENVWRRPRLPLGATSHCIFLSSQMVRSPVAFSAALYALLFVVRYLRRPQLVLLLIRAYYRCSPDLCNKAP